MLRIRYPLHAAAALAAAFSALPAAAQVMPASCPQFADSLPPLEVSLDPDVVLTADQVDLSEQGLSQLLGSVRLRQADKEFTAENLEYDEASQRVRIKGESLFRSRELAIRSQQASFEIEQQTGSFEGTEFTLPSRAARGNADEIALATDGTAVLDEVRYTTCAPGDNAWYLEAGTIKLDHEEGLGTARNARLRFMGVPILYLPWLQFPIDDRRRTGVLFPTVGESSRTGWDVRVPVYLNLGPNYDATITPRYMSDRGIQTSVTGRYLLERAEGEAGYELLSEDRRTGERRDYLRFNHRGLLNRRTSVDLRFAEVSDPAYFEDFGGDVDLSSITHLERSARLSYQSPGVYRIQALVQDYQPIASNLLSLDDPYRRLPQIRIDGITRDAIWNTRLGMSAEYVNFARDNSVEGQRVDLHPYLRMERDQVSWFAKSQLDFRYTTYELTGTAAGQPQQPDRALPLFSAEAGLRFDRHTASGATQTLEPRLFYLYVPYENQDDLPVFDSGEPDFDFTQLFARNRFSGEDRISDANQFAVAVTGRQIDGETGAVKAAASVGQLFRFESTRVALPGEPAPDRGATDFIGSLDYYLDARWGVRLATQWSPENSEFSRNSVSLRYLTDRQRFEVAYRYRADLLEQTDLIAVTPIWGPFSLSGRWRYSLRDQQSLDTFLGVEYQTCCWTLRTSWRRYVTNTTGDINSGIYLQLELKGLARIGSGLENLFPDPEVY